MKKTLLILSLWLTLAGAWAGNLSEGPIGAPGLPHIWAPAKKQAVGTAYEETGAKSPVWFTVAEGILTETFYPRIDQPQIGDLQFIVTDGKGYFSEQKRDTVSQVTYKEDGASVRITGREKSGRYEFTQEIVADTAAPVIRIRTTMKWNEPGLRLFVLFNPAINNAAKNVGLANEQGLFASEARVIRFESGKRMAEAHAALVASLPWQATSVGYVGFSDGWQDLSRHFRMTQSWREAGPGNVALTGELRTPQASTFSYELALGFGGTRSEAQTQAQLSMRTPFEKARLDYDNGWAGYLNRLQQGDPGSQILRQSSFARRSAFIIKAHEDKVSRGAIIASLSKPGIPERETSKQDNLGGYHLIWPRDLYHAGMGLLAAGDLKTPVHVLKYLFETQEEDGSWPQNYWVDGTPYWKSIQLDEIAFPILLAWQLQKRGVYHVTRPELEMIKRAAWFIVNHGPATKQDRWEEVGGYVPSTLAAEIAALRAATRLTQEPHFAEVAEYWQSRLEGWTLVQDGPWGRNYYLRVSQWGNANVPEELWIANGGGRAWSTEVLDGGFLELVRLGVRSAHDPNILNTLRVYDSPKTGLSLGLDDRAGAATYRRYHRDAYGPNQVGGYWPLLAGERGHYAILAGDLTRAQAQLSVLESAALPSGHLPEQTLGADASKGVGSGVATPLVWAHAEDLRLRRSLEIGAVFDAP